MTVELAGAFWVLPLAAALLALSGLLIVYRLLRGPSRPDRAVAIDALTLLAVAVMALAALFSAQAARDGDVVRRSVRDVERILGRTVFERELRRRGYRAVENSGQFVIFCNRAPVRPIE